ncbi:MAG: LD-carboxypeptidase [Kiritimatiellae bacterium]|nr:LD-carboxypeptidase [Kiritimatiellia bacterium]
MKPLGKCVLPPGLAKGDVVAVCAPASWMPGGVDAAVVARLEAAGFRVRLAPSCTRHEGFFAMPDAERAEELLGLFADDGVKAILCARGGYGAARILSALDFDFIARHPKLVVGFSDITALHVALAERAGLAVVHGPMAATLTAEKSTPETWEAFLAGLADPWRTGDLAAPFGGKLETVAGGTAEGKLAGGNLSVLASLAGTPWALRGDGAVLLLEEVGEKSYRIDRMLWQLEASGLFDRIAGVVFGEFTACGADEGDEPTEAVLAAWAKRIGRPAVKGLPAGHGKDNLFLPLGVPVRLDATAGRLER